MIQEQAMAMKEPGSTDSAVAIGNLIGGAEGTRGSRSGTVRKATRGADRAMSAAPVSDAITAETTTGDGRWDGSPLARRRSQVESDTRGGRPSLRKDLRDFISEHPEGWDHDAWLGLVDHLREHGHDVADTDAIGSTLERERLEQMLQKIPRLGAQRVRLLTERFGTLWSLRRADTDEVAQAANIPQSLAARIASAIR
jgi:hypothetical protein